MVMQADSFATVYAQAYLNDDFTTPASSIGISAEINQIDDTNAQISIIKESDKNTVINRYSEFWRRSNCRNIWI